MMPDLHQCVDGTCWNTVRKLTIGLQQSLYGPCRKMKTSYSRRDVSIAIVIDGTVNEDEPRICQEKREFCKGSKRRQVGL